MLRKLFVSALALLAASSISTGGAAATASPQWSIGATQNSTCVIQVGGDLWCWGDNQYGQLGIGIFGAPVGAPTQESTTATDWRYLFDSSGNHTCAIKANGTLWCWGLNEDGQLGLGDTTDRSVPTQVGSDTTWVSGGAGQYSTCAIKANGTLWCWGSNGAGQAGNGTSGASLLTPTQADLTGWITVSMGYNHACGIRTGGTLWCWGENGNGQLGIGTSDPQLHPVQVAGTWNAVDTSTDGPGDYTCGIKPTGTLWCWGFGGYPSINTLGLGDTYVTATPAEVSYTWSSVAVGAWTSCGIQADSSLWCWGDGWAGNLATGVPGDEGDSTTPVATIGGTGWAALARGRDHGCGVRTDATVWCWGQNSYLEIGVGSAGEVNSTPLQVDLTAGGFDLPRTDRDGSPWTLPLALLAALTAAAGVAVRRREGNAVAEAAARG